MERFLIKREPYVSQEKIVRFDNQSLTGENPNNIKLEYNESNAIGIMPTCSENYFEIKQELDSSFEDHPMHEVENIDTEEIVDIVNHSLIDEKLNNINLEDIDQNTSSVRMFSGKYSDIKQELDYSRQDHSICDINEASSDDSLSKLRNAKVVLERLSIVQILEYTKKSEKGSECTYSMSVDALKYVCKRFRLKCDSTFETAIQHIINHQECGCVPTMAYYQCTRCNKHLSSYTGIQNHIMTIKTSCKFGEKRFLHLEEFNNDECKKLDCPKCNVSLENVAQFVKHVNDCKEVPKFWCSLCGHGIKHVNDFRAHLKFHPCQSTQSTIGFSTKESTQNECDRQERKPLKFICYCSACDEIFVKHGSIPSNSKKCGTSYTYRCLTCGKEYSDRKSIKGHIDSACNTSKDYRCLVCKQKEFSSLNTLKRHMFYCGKTPHLHCEFCSYKTKFSNDLQRHLKNHFEKDRSFIDQNQDEGRLDYLFCEQCNKLEENGEYRKKQYYCFKCNSKLLLKCRRCNAVHKFRRSMTAHLKSDCELEIKSELQKCPKCGRQYKNLNLHKNCQDQIKYCAHCSYSTNYTCKLIRHLFNNHEERGVSK